MEAIQFLVFRIGTEWCAFRAGRIREIVHMASLSQPPTRPSSLTGFLNLGGTAVPVLRLDRLLRLHEEDPGLYTPILILRDSRFVLGLLVHEVQEVVSVLEGEILSVPERDSLNSCVSGLLCVSGVSIHVLDPEQILLEEERRRLNEFQALEQKRLDEMEVEPSWRE